MPKTIVLYTCILPLILLNLSLEGTTPPPDSPSLGFMVIEARSEIPSPFAPATQVPISYRCAGVVVRPNWVLLSPYCLLTEPKKTSYLFSLESNFNVPKHYEFELWLDEKHLAPYHTQDIELLELEYSGDSYALHRRSLESDALRGMHYLHILNPSLHTKPAAIAPQLASHYHPFPFVALIPHKQFKTRKTLFGRYKFEAYPADFSFERDYNRHFFHWRFHYQGPRLAGAPIYMGISQHFIGFYGASMPRPNEDLECFSGIKAPLWEPQNFIPLNLPADFDSRWQLTETKPIKRDQGDFCKICTLQ